MVTEGKGKDSEVSGKSDIFCHERTRTMRQKER